MKVIKIGDQFDAAHKYFQLGLLDQAHAELDVLDEVPEISLHLSTCRMDLFAYQKRWHDAGICADNLCALEPDNPDHFLASAEIQRHLGLVESAIGVLLHGPLDLVGLPAYHFQLACYEAELGDHNAARDSLLTALDLDASWIKRAQAEPVLAPFLESIPPSMAGKSQNTDSPD